MASSAEGSTPEYPPIGDVDFNKRGWKPPQTTMGGDGPVLIYPSVSESDRSWVQFGIYEPPTDSVMATDITKHNHDEVAPKRQAELEQMPVVRTNFHLQEMGFKGEPHKGNNRRVYITNISPEVYQRFKDIDEANIQALVANSKAWFKRQLSEEGVRLGYIPCATMYPKPEKVDDPSKCKPAIACRLDVRPERLDVLVQSPDAYNVLNPGTYMDIPHGARNIPYFTDSGVFVRKTESGAQIMLSAVVVMEGGGGQSRPKPPVGGMGFTVSSFQPSASAPQQQEQEPTAGSFDAFSTMAQQGSAMASGAGAGAADFGGDATHVGGGGFGQAVMY